VFDKLDAYNLVANLVPGAALLYALHSSGFPTPGPDEFAAFLLVSFVAGVMTNRLGSLVLDPILRHPKVKFLHPKNYKAFLTFEKQDSKLDTIVANTGLYRTFVTAGISYLILMSINIPIKIYQVSSDFIFYAFVVLGIFVSAFALKKEDNYIQERMKCD
jgi:hypothetical protein